MTYQIIIFLYFVLLGAAVISDIDSRTIPNEVTLAIVILYPAHVLAAPQPVAWLPAIALAAAALTVCLLPFARGWMGGGDVKLIAATVLWAGPTRVADVLLLTAVAGGAFALLMVGRNRFALAAACRAVGLPRLGDAFLGRDIPYALAIAAGAIGGSGPALLGHGA